MHAQFILKWLFTGCRSYAFGSSGGRVLQEFTGLPHFFCTFSDCLRCFFRLLTCIGSLFILLGLPYILNFVSWWYIFSNPSRFKKLKSIKIYIKFIIYYKPKAQRTLVLSIYNIYSSSRKKETNIESTGDQMVQS